jgi:Zn ribbon nucleic-acid-binding protein
VNQAKKFVTSADCPECGFQALLSFYPDQDRPTLFFRECERCETLFAIRVELDLRVTRYEVEEV